MLTESRRNDLIGAIAVAVLIIGTATGSGLAMLVMSLIALILIGVLFPKQCRIVALSPCWRQLSRERSHS